MSTATPATGKAVAFPFLPCPGQKSPDALDMMIPNCPVPEGRLFVDFLLPGQKVWPGEPLVSFTNIVTKGAG